MIAEPAGSKPRAEKSEKCIEPQTIEIPNNEQEISFFRFPSFVFLFLSFRALRRRRLLREELSGTRRSRIVPVDALWQI